MSKNYMKEVAELLGVELGEKFEIENSSFNPCYIKENGLYDCDCVNRSGFLVYLLTGEMEIEKTILTEKERKYLASVIAPRQIYKNVVYIEKCQQIYEDNCFISIQIYAQNGSECICLPYFKENEMYIGMEADKKYTLQELGLSRDE